MNHASLFSGIGGFDLAAEWMGWNNVLQCEWDEFCQTILNYYWPNAELKKDIKATDFTGFNGQIDILTGGFPCQPYSSAGKRLGKEDDRHLWPEMLRAIREIEPKWVVGENVSGIVNWNEGVVFEEVQADLEGEGYEVQAFILPASGINAPHKRERTWFVAYSCCKQRPLPIQQWRQDTAKNINSYRKNKGRITANTNKERQADRHEQHEPIQQGQYIRGNPKIDISNTTSERLERLLQSRTILSPKLDKGVRWRDFPTQSPVCGGNDGLPAKLDGIAFPKWRNESIKGYGNAVVPQLVYQIFCAIEETEKQ